MLAVLFLSVWIGIAAAVRGRGRWLVAGPLVLVCGLAALGELAALYWGAWLTPVGAIALGMTAGWTESRRANGVALAVVAVNLVAYAFLGFGRYDPPSFDGGTRFALVALAIYAVPALMGRALHDLVRWTERRELTEREARRIERQMNEPAAPAAPRDPGVPFL